MLLYGLDYFNKFDPNLQNDVLVEQMLDFVCKKFDADEIYPNLYLGNWLSSLNLNMLKERKIKRIVTVHHTLPPIYPEDFEYLIIRAQDINKQNLLDYFIDAINFISEGLSQGNAVLVHW